MRWLYPANIRTAILDGWLTTILIDSGAHMNCVTPEFAKARGLVAGSIQDLNNHSRHIPINGVGGEAYRAPGVCDDSSAGTTSPELRRRPSSPDRRGSVHIFSTMSHNTRNSDHIPGCPSNGRIRNAQPGTGVAIRKGRI